MVRCSTVTLDTFTGLCLLTWNRDLKVSWGSKGVFHLARGQREGSENSGNATAALPSPHFSWGSLTGGDTGLAHSHPQLFLEMALPQVAKHLGRWGSH